MHASAHSANSDCTKLKQKLEQNKKQYSYCAKLNIKNTLAVLINIQYLVGEFRTK